MSLIKYRKSHDEKHTTLHVLANQNKFDFVTTLSQAFRKVQVLFL